MHSRKLAVAALAFFLSAFVAATAQAAHRVALVIGNDQYQNLPKLKKAVADAEAYAEVLKAKGFDQVILKTDLTRDKLDEAVASFLDQIEPGDTAVFAYSGHGWSDGAQNYIVGTDAPLAGSQDFLARISIPLKNGTNGVIDEMDQKGAALKVAIIDACRDNPFAPPPGKRSIGLKRGMTRVDPPGGTFVVFSAGAGQSALDRLSDQDPDPNSVFTRVFARAIQADMTLQDAIKATQEQVVKLAESIQQDQKPAYYDEVIGSACLSEKCTSGSAPVITPTLPVVTAPPPDETAWRRIAPSTDVADFEGFVRIFPDSVHVAEARAKIEQLKNASAQKTAAFPSVPPQPPASVGYSYVGPVGPPDPWLALRDQPSSSQGRRLMQMPEGTVFQVLRQQGQWAYVRLQDGTEGWANSAWIRCCKYLSASAEPAKVAYSYVGPVGAPDPWLALRDQPSSNQGHRLMQMPEGTLFRVLRQEGQWAYVRLQDGTEGWANTGWIRCCKYLPE
jgi:hypothetical protein